MDIKHYATPNFTELVTVNRTGAHPIELSAEIARGPQAEQKVIIQMSRQQAIMLRAALDEAIKDARRD